MVNTIKYDEISRAKVSSARDVVISKCSKGGFTIAQQLKAVEGDKSTTVFLKGAIHVDSVNELHELRDAINLAIKTTEETTENDSDWD